MSAETRQIARSPKRLNEIKELIRKIVYGNWRDYIYSDEIEELRKKIKEWVLEDLFLFDYFILSAAPEGTCRDIEYNIHYPGTLIIGKEEADDELLEVLEEIKEKSNGAFEYSPWIKKGTKLGLVAIEYPTGFFKTSAFKRSGALWLYLRNPEERQLIARETASLAYQDLEFIMNQIERNEVFRWVFREYIPTFTPRRWSKKAFDMPRKGNYGEPSFIALGVGGAIRGMHFTTIWLDDIHGERAFYSQSIMQQTIDWALSISTRLVGELNRKDPYSGIFPKIRITQNRGSQWDVHSAFEENYGDKFCYIRYKAVDKDWKSSFPKRYTTEELLRRANSENPTEKMIFWIQFMNMPSQSELTEFKKEWLKFFDIQIYSDDKIIIDEDDHFSLSQCSIIGWIDLASAKESKKGSQNAIIVIAIAPNGRKYLLEAWRKKATQDEAVNKILQFHDIYNFNEFFIESYAQQSEFKTWLDREAKRTGRDIITTLETPPSSKWNRIPDLTMYFKTGELRIRKGLKEFMVEYENFPYISTCDILDALSAAMYVCKKYGGLKPGSIRAIHTPILNKTTGV